jgi:hypothetical protein
MVQATQEYYLARIAELEKELVLGLNSLEAQVRQLELEKAQLLLRVSDLEMALEREQALQMGKE